MESVGTCGTVPALFTEKKDGLMNQVRQGLGDTRDVCWEWDNVHAILVMSPAEETLRRRDRNFPGLESNTYSNGRSADLDQLAVALFNGVSCRVAKTRADNSTPYVMATRFRSLLPSTEHTALTQHLLITSGAFRSVAGLESDAMVSFTGFSCRGRALLQVH
jgi:hypothetical protein